MKKIYALAIGALVIILLFIHAAPPNTTCISTVTIHLDSTALRTLKASPVLLLSAPGSGYHLQIILIEGTVVTHGNYFTNSIIYTYMNTNAQDNRGWYSQLLQDTSTTLEKFTQTLNDYDLVTNAPLYLTSDTILATGNSELNVNVTYRWIADTGSTDCDPTPTIGSQCTDTFHLTSAQIKTLNSNPIIILPAPPVGFYIKPIGVDADYHYGGTAYVGNTILSIFIADTTRNIGTNNATLADTRNTLRGFSIGSGGAELAVNSPLKITTQLGNTTTGTGNIDLYITYKIIPIGQNSCTAGQIGPSGPKGDKGDNGTSAGSSIQFTEEFANYTLQLSDTGKILFQKVAGANTVTVPPNSSVPFPIGTQLTFVQDSTGQTQIVAGAGVTIRSAFNVSKTTTQNAWGFLYKKGTDLWYLEGQLQ